MRKRKHALLVYLDDKENEELTEWAKACRMNKSRYIRELIKGFRPVEFPPADYMEIMEQLRTIGVNMNQLAVKANSLGFIDEPEYRKNAQLIWSTCADMAKLLTNTRAKIPFRNKK